MENLLIPTIVSTLIVIALTIILVIEKVRLKNWGKALGEILLILFISNIPLLSVLLNSALDPGNLDWTRILSAYYSFGKSLIFVSAILAPVIYTLLFRIDKAPKLFVWLYVLGTGFCLWAAGIVYSRELSGIPTDEDVLQSIGWTLIFISLILWFFSRVFENSLASGSPGVHSKDRSQKIGDNLK